MAKKVIPCFTLVGEGTSKGGTREITTPCGKVLKKKGKGVTAVGERKTKKGGPRRIALQKKVAKELCAAGMEKNQSGTMAHGRGGGSKKVNHGPDNRKRRAVEVVGRKEVAKPLERQCREELREPKKKLEKKTRALL